MATIITNISFGKSTIAKPFFIIVIGIFVIGIGIFCISRNGLMFRFLAFHRSQGKTLSILSKHFSSVNRYNMAKSPYRWVHLKKNCNAIVKTAHALSSSARSVSLISNRLNKATASRSLRQAKAKT